MILLATLPVTNGGDRGASQNRLRNFHGYHFLATGEIVG